MPCGDDPGWMLPLVVLCPVYSCTLNSMSTDDSFPLPPSQLYDPSDPRRGFLSLLKQSLWQLLWSDSQPQQGLVGVNPKAAELRTELRVSGGRLLRLLHDRNVLRRWAPSPSFAPPPRFSPCSTV